MHSSKSSVWLSSVIKYKRFCPKRHRATRCTNCYTPDINLTAGSISRKSPFKCNLFNLLLNDPLNSDGWCSQQTSCSYPLPPPTTGQRCASHAISCRYGWSTAGKGTPHCLCCAGICGNWSLSGPTPACKWGTPDSPARPPHWPLWTPPDWPCSSCFCFFGRCPTSLSPWSPCGLLEAPAAY